MNLKKINQIYPQYLQELFTNRESELKRLEILLDQMNQGSLERITLFGLRRIGKSLVAKEFIRRIFKEKIEKVLPIFINFEGICSSTSLFAEKFICQTYFWSRKDLSSSLGNLNQLLRIAPKEKVVQETIAQFNEEISKRELNQINLLELAFSFPEKLANEINKKIILILDEFQELTTLRHQVEDPLKIFRKELEKQNEVSYILLGSIISLMKKLIGEHKSPLFGQFEKIELKPFTKEATRKLVQKIIKIDDPCCQQLIYKYSTGNPFYAHHLARRILILKQSLNLEVKPEIVRQAFLIETLSKEGKIYDFCNYIYSTSLEKAKGYGALKAVLNILAQEQGLTLTEISRRMSKIPPTVKDYLEALEDVDLIVNKNNRYYYQDPVLRYWVAKTEWNIEIDEFPREKDVFDLVKELDEKFQSVSTELGKTKEYEHKVKLEKRFNLKLENYNKNNIEFDLIGKKNNILYIFEIKHRNKPTNYKDIKEFLEKIEKSELKGKKKLFFISKAGFTAQAKKLMKRDKIEILN